jgi:magnesium chelatase subunit D
MLHPARAEPEALTPWALWAIAPQALGGLRLRCRAGPARDAALALCRLLVGAQQAADAALPAATPCNPCATAPPPWLRWPHHADTEALHGGLDLAATLSAGRPVRNAGLLERAQGGVLVVAMAERLSLHSASVLAQALDQSTDSTHSSTAAPSLLLLDEGIEADEAPPAALCERLALLVHEADPALASLAPGFNPDLGHSHLAPAPAASTDLVQNVARAAARWPQVVVEDPLLHALAAAAAAFGLHSPRVLLQALVATRVAAAWAGRAVAEAADASLAVQWVLMPRARQWPSAVEEEAPPPPPPDEAEQSAQDEAADPCSADPPDPAQTRALEDRLIDAAQAKLPPGLLAALAALAGQPRHRSAQGSSRFGQKARALQRGRVLGVVPGDPRRGARLALLDTLRAAVPWQALRTRGNQTASEAAQMHDSSTPRPPTPPRRLLVRREDLCVQKREQARGSTTLFVIDASGSQALHRLAEAKGAVELLLADCYARRDQVAVIGFRGRTAELLLPPTRSLVRAKRLLAGLPGGGGTPLAAGLDAAGAIAEQQQRQGSTPWLVLLTDGRANVARDGTPGRELALSDALASARAWARLRLPALLIDTGAQASSSSQALAQAMGARWVALPHAQAQAQAQLVASWRSNSSGSPARAPGRSAA